MVACTMLMAFEEPRLFESTSWMPAHSSTARTGPPAMTPVPALAGLSSTTPAASSPCTGCGIDAAIRGTLKKCFLASSTPLAMAAGTSLALPYPTPTVPSPSPTTTSAVKLNRRPPFTTLATRLIATTRSTCGLFSGAGPPRPPSRRSRRSPPPPPPRRCGPGIRRPSRSSSSRSRCCGWSSELQPAGARRLGERGDPAVVLVAAAVEHHRTDARRPGPLGQLLADRAGLRGLVAAGIELVGGRGHQRDAPGVVHDLRVQVPGRAGDHQPGPGRGATDLLAEPEMSAEAGHPPPSRDAGADLGNSHGHLPVFPALRRMTSPW